MIEFENVGYSYGEDELFSQVNLTIEPGSFHFLTGASGAGKTTLLRLCYGDLQVTQGQVRLFGQAAQSLDRNGVAEVRRRIGVVHQDCQFVDHLSLLENIALPLIVSGRGDVHEKNLQELMEWVGLTHRAQHRPPELSGGERQRAALARAVIMAPDVIIADEPTGNIDGEMSQRLLMLLAELHRMGNSVLIATHDMGLIRSARSMMVQARTVRLQDRQLRFAGADL